MRMLFEARRSGEGLATLGAGVAARAVVLGADVALEVGRIGKYLKYDPGVGCGEITFHGGLARFFTSYA